MDLSYRFDCLSLQFSMFAPEIVYMLLIKLHRFKYLILNGVLRLALCMENF